MGHASRHPSIPVDTAVRQRDVAELSFDRAGTLVVGMFLSYAV